MPVGTLYLVATPIGNLEDITFRAVRVLKDVDVIACEDTRHTRLLLSHYGIATPLVSYHEHNERRRAPELLARLRAGESVAIVSDAGMPALSDPGYTLIREAIDRGVPVVPVPGASAVTAALAVSGLPADHFVFVGFLPRTAGARRRALQEMAALPWTLVMFEAPHRIERTLDDVRTTLGNRPVALVRELTKRFEEVIRGSTDEVLERVRAVPPKGELTLVVAGAPERAAGGEAEATAHLRRLLEQGSTLREAVRTVAAVHRVPKRAAYRLALEILGKR